MTWLFFIILGIGALAIRQQLSNWVAGWSAGTLKQYAWAGVAFLIFMLLFGGGMGGELWILHAAAAVGGILGFFSIGQLSRRRSSGSTKTYQEQVEEDVRQYLAVHPDSGAAEQGEVEGVPVADNPTARGQQPTAAGSGDRLLDILQLVALKQAADNRDPAASEPEEPARKSTDDRVSEGWAVDRHAGDTAPVDPRPAMGLPPSTADVVEPYTTYSTAAAATSGLKESAQTQLLEPSGAADLTEVPAQEAAAVPADAAGHQPPQARAYQAGPVNLAKSSGPVASGPVKLGQTAVGQRPAGPVTSLGRGFSYTPQIVQSSLQDRLAISIGSDDEPADEPVAEALDTGTAPSA